MTYEMLRDTITSGGIDASLRTALAVPEARILSERDRYADALAAFGELYGTEGEISLYSVGGRIKFGETAEEAVVREVWEETGVKMKVDRLGFVQENYFYGDSPSNLGKIIYEISFYFYMKMPDAFAPVCKSFTEEDNSQEHLQ